MISYSINIPVEFELKIRCNNCEEELTVYDRGDGVYDVNMCSGCLKHITDEEYKTGYTEGEAAGFSDGHEEGKKEGYDDGFKDGLMESDK